MPVKQWPDDRAKTVAELHDDVSKLVRPYSTNDGRHDSLFNQLRAEMVRGTPSDGQNGPASATESKPPTSADLLQLSIDMVRTPAMLAAQVAKRTRSSPESNLTLAEASLASVHLTVLTWVKIEVEQLRDNIETALNWQHSPTTTNARCPRCKRKGLMVMMDDFGPAAAACPKCKMKWDKGSLGLLAMQIMEDDHAGE